MKTYKVKKLFRGYASVRDYIVEECIAKKESLLIKFNNEQMIVSLETLERRFRFHSNDFQSQFGNTTYKLYDFKFIPDEKEEDND